jgi:hypothetical protein
VTKVSPLMFSLFAWLAALPLTASSVRAQKAPRAVLPSTAFYYGHSIPRELAAAYEQIVVQPEHAGNPEQIRAWGSEPVAYLSVGEAAPSQAKSLAPSWILTQNAAWGSLVMDLAQADYRAYLLSRYEALWARGYHRFFLDTLDSYQLAAKTDDARAKQTRGIVEFLKAMKARHPEVKILVNRGFELLPEIAPHVHGVVAESLFDRWDAGKKQYTRVPEGDREWLLARLREAHDRFGLPVLVIDYRPTTERAAAIETAKKILKLGFEPWVCNGDLSDIGVGRYEILPRRVLLLTDTPVKVGSVGSGPLSWLAPVLEYLGYVPEVRSVNAGLTSEASDGRYAGVITWFEGGSVPSGYGRWMVEQVRAGARFAVFGALGFDPTSPEARELGFALARDAVAAKAGSIVSRDALIGFETDPPLHPVPGSGLVLEGKSVTSHLRALDQAGHACDAIATAAWGGVATSHVFGLRGLHGERAWALDPFAFLTRALRLPVMPVPDVTTENGRRLALFVVETQGAGDRARLRGRPAVWTVLRDEVIAPSGWPHALHSASLDGEERAAVQSLLQLPATYAGELPGGDTDARGALGSLTRVQAMAMEQADGLGVVSPIAWDSRYVLGGAESYPYEQVIETLEFTDAPRRLKPAALHYHAYAASSPAGIESLKRVYAWLAAHEVLPIRIADYTARVAAFRDQVIARDLDGAFSVFGGEALRTLRVPAELGFPNLAASSGVSSVRTIPQGRYVSFAGAGPRKLTLGAPSLEQPHVVQANGLIQRFEAQDGRIQLEVSGPASLELTLAGLPAEARCELRLARRQLRLTTSAGRSLELRLPERSTGPSELRCGEGQ